MKPFSALLLTMLGLCVLPAVSGADKPSPAPTPAKPTPAPVPAPAKAEEKQKPIIGPVLNRPGGGFLNLFVENNNFVLRFLDKDKKDADADLARGFIWFRKNLQTSRFFLLPEGEGKTLKATQYVRPPYIFTVLHLVLFKEGGTDEDEEKASEAYTINFNQITASDGATVPIDQLTPEQLQKANQSSGVAPVKKK
jgi:hypothetical protein